eukprot:12915599-Prorocentrum_lima.AAC.1
MGGSGGGGRIVGGFLAKHCMVEASEDAEVVAAMLFQGNCCVLMRETALSVSRRRISLTGADSSEHPLLWGLEHEE